MAGFEFVKPNINTDQENSWITVHIPIVIVSKSGNC